MYLAPENHARPGVSRESLWCRHSYELVVIGYNQQLLGTMVLNVVPSHLRALSLLVLCGSKGKWNTRFVGLIEPAASQTIQQKSFSGSQFAKYRAPRLVVG